MSRFREIFRELKAEVPYNLHSHTQFCDGRNTMAEFAEAAVRAGMSHYGFSPHSPVNVASTCNMSRTAVHEYIAEVNRLRELYSGAPTRFLMSMEIDYIGPEWGASIDYFQQLPLDYRIGSVHFIPDLHGGVCDIDGAPEHFARNLHEVFDDNLRYVVDKFYEQSMAMVEAGGFDIIGHLDKIGYNASTIDPEIESQPWYRNHVEELISAVAAKGLTAEINTKAYARTGRFFPHQRHFRRLMDAGIPMVVNSDAHYTELIDASRHEALEMLAGI